MFRQKALMYRAMTLPQNDSRRTQPFLGEAAVDLVRVPHHSFRKRNSHGEGSVAAQMLVRKEQHPLGTREGPIEGGLGVRRRAYQTAAFATERFDCGR